MDMLRLVRAELKAMMFLMIVMMMVMVMVILVLAATLIVMAQFLLKLNLLPVFIVNLNMLTVIVTMSASSMASMAVFMQDGHDAKVAAQSENRGPEHEDRFFDDRTIYDPLGCLNEQLCSDKPYDGYVRQCSKRL